MHCFTMDSNKIYITRPNKDTEATPEEIQRFEKTTLADFGRGKDVYLIEKFPKRFFIHATKIKLEKVDEPVSTLSDESNSRLFRVLSTYSIYQ